MTGSGLHLGDMLQGRTTLHSYTRFKTKPAHENGCLCPAL